MVKPGKLLLVENDQPVRDALMRVLAGENYDVIAVFDPEQAIEAFKTNNIDIVILDLNLADLDGGVVLATLKQLDGEIPVVVISAQSDRISHPSVAAASAFLEKPFDIGELLGVLKQASGLEEPTTTPLPTPLKAVLGCAALMLALWTGPSAWAQQAGTAPSFRLDPPVFQDGNVILQWQGGGATNQVQVATSLDGTWENLGAPTTASGLTNPVLWSTAFFRVVTTTDQVAAAKPAGGQLQWVTGTTGSASGDLAIANSVKGDHRGNVIVAGQFKGTVNLGDGPRTSTGGNSSWDGFVVKYDAQGRFVWARTFGSVGDEMANGVAVDSADNVIVVGQFSYAVDFGGGLLSSLSGTDIFVAKYSPNGAHLWSKGFGASGVSANDWATSVAVDSADNIVVGGEVYGYPIDFGTGALPAIGGQDIFLVKMDANGAAVWSRRYGGGSGDMIKSLALDRSGDVVITGYINGTSTDLGGGVLNGYGNGDILLAKYSGGDGGFLWGKLMGSTGADVAYAVAVDPTTDNIIVTGGYNGSVDFGGGALGTSGGGAVFVACYNSGGEFVWAKNYGGEAYSSDVGTGVAVDNQGNIVVTGNVQSAVNFGGDWLFGDGAQDYFVVKYSNLGQFQWAQRDNGATGWAASFDAANNVLTAGSFGATVDFGGDTVSTAYGSKSAFVAKYSP